MIDLHCHIDLYPDPVAVLQAVAERRMYVLSVTTTPRAFPIMRRLTKGMPRVRIGLGLHPELAAERHTEVDLFPRMLNETDYVGEVGIDGSPAHRETLMVQQRVFSRILEHCADHGGKILSIHSRGAAGRVMDALENCPEAGTPVFHWFSGTHDELKRAVAMGGWFSVGPAMLRSAKGLDLVAAMPADRVLTETDGPFARNGRDPLYPWDLEGASEALAKVWKTEADEVNMQLSSNLKTLSSAHRMYAA